jgi:hypothetical protein
MALIAFKLTDIVAAVREGQLTLAVALAKFPLADVSGSIRHGIGAFYDLIFLPDADEFSAPGQNKNPFPMAQAVFEIADKLLTGGGHHGAIPVDAIALGTLIRINTKRSAGNPYKKRDEK